MRHRFFIPLPFIWISLIILPAGALATIWPVDHEHSATHFTVRHMGITDVRGFFGDVRGEADWNEQGLPRKLAVTITVDSIQTGVKKRDDHLKNSDFFEAATYPHITFVSKAITAAVAGHQAVTGDLTIHGITKEISVDMLLTPPVNDPWGNVRRGAKLTGRVNRTDFGMTYNAVLGDGRLLIGEEVEIVVDLQFIHKQAPTGK